MDKVEKAKALLQNARRNLARVEGFGAGVEALWSDELQTIVAFAFEKLLWERSEAEAHVAEMFDVEQKEVATWDA